MRRFGRKSTISVLALLAMAVLAWAYWTTTGTGVGSTAAGDLQAATISVPATSEGSHDVTWTQQATTGDAGRDSQITYTVERKLGAGTFEPIASGLCSGDLPHGTSSCNDTVDSGSYTYRVVAAYESWTATSNEASVEVDADDTVPPEVVSIDRADPDPTKAQSVSWTVTFDESVEGVDGTDFTLVEGGGVSGSDITDVTPAGPADTYTVTADTGTGSGTLRLDLVDDDTIQDDAGNPLGGTGTTGPEDGSFTGQEYTLDKTAPEVDSIDRADPDPTNAGSVSWTVTFSESVSGVDAADFDLVAAGLGGTPAITGVTPSGPADTYTVTASTGSGSGTLGLDLDDDDTIEDAVNNALGGTGTTGAEDGSFTGQEYSIDRTSPTVQSINRDGSELTNASTVSWTVTFNENVSNVETGDFALAEGSGLSGSTLATVVPVNGSTYTVTANTGAGDGNLGLNLVDDDSIEDGVGNKLGGTGTGNGNFTGQTFHIDKTGPSVQSIARNDPNPTNAGSVSWTVTFDDSSVQGVDDTGPGEGSDFDLVTTGGVTGATITDVTAVSGSTYTVTASTGTGNGTVRLDLDDDDSITDQLGNPLGGVGTSGAGDGSFQGVASVYTIDKTVPTVSSINRATASPTNAGSVNWTVTFSESVSGVTAADFDLVVSGLGGTPTITNVTPAGPTATYTVTASTGTGSGTLGLDLDDDDSITDAATNELGGTGIDNGDFTGQVYAIDKTAPTVSSINRANSSPTNAGSVSWTVTFSEDVTGVNTGDFALAQAGGVSGASITSVTPTSGPEDVYTVTANTGSNSGTLGLNLVDNNSIVDGVANPLGGPGGIANGDFTGEVYAIDKTAPTVQTIDRADASPTNASSVSWTVTFSEDVSGVNAGDFNLVQAGGVSGASITSVTPSSGPEDVYTVTANTGSNSGTLGLNLVDNDSITDGVGNALGGAGNGNGNLTGQVYTIDRTAPTVQTINRAGANPTGAASVSWTVTFSENVSGVNAGDFALAEAGGVSGASITSVTPNSGPEDVYTVTANTGTGEGTLGLNLVDDDSITDGAGNALGGAGNGNGNLAGQTYTIDRTAPALTTLEMFDNDKDGKVDQVKATFDDTLASSTATGPWTLTDVPSGGTLASVTTAGPVATLNITEGGNAADTSVGAFQIALAADAAGIRDNAGNQSSFSATAPDDEAAPAPIAIEMFDTNGPLDGKVDQVKLTFSEDLQTPYTAPNTIWTLANAPGGATNTLSAVAMADEVATLTLNQGNVNTAAGTYSGTTLNDFTVALAGNANGVRDAAANQTSFAAKDVTDKAKPIPTLLTFDPDGATTGNSTPGINDRFSVAFSEPLAVTSMCNPTWTNNLTNQLLNGNGGNNVILQITNNNAPTTNNDLLSVQSPGGGRCGTAIRFGSLDLGSQGYITTATTRTFSGNNASESRIEWAFGTSTLTFELGSISGGAASAVASPALPAIYAPQATVNNAMTDIPGNEISGTASNNGAGNTRW